MSTRHATLEDLYALGRMETNRIERQCQHPDCAWNGCNVEFAKSLEAWLPSSNGCGQVFGLQRDLPTSFYAVDADHYADMYDAGTEPDGWDANGSPVGE